MLVNCTMIYSPLVITPQKIKPNEIIYTNETKSNQVLLNTP